ncbi:hypothetical protein [Nocardia asteroides]|uniref:hypothetical protein n=1 Tax=Nocardia asteroides TaxID=1824 RepID=UPI001E430F8D|nr:hypothetical protein [Nocardia asteroides]UGT59087.1 hypothetical protein LTT61_17480 [Nocardia asteroides]
MTTAVDRTGAVPGAADPLDELVRTLAIGAAADQRIGERLGAAARQARRPPVIQITGRSGAGRSTVAAALALISAVQTGPVDEPGSAAPVLDGDIVVYVIAGAPLPADRRALDAVPEQRAVVVLNKADAIGTRWSDAVAAAERCAAELGIATVPVVASLAVRTRAGTVSTDDLAALRALAERDDPTLTLAPDLFLAPGPDLAVRERLLRDWDLYGVNCALAALRHDPLIGTRALLQLLHAASGIDPLHGLLHKRYEQIGALRGGELLDEIARLAARAVPVGGSVARDLLERHLDGDEARWLGLRAGLACPQVAHLAAGYPAPAPADADDALARAHRWRAVAGGDLPAPARRAALRVHAGYVRLWERLSGAGL